MNLRQHGPQLLFLLCISLLAAPVQGQTFTGTVVGRVFDPQQAVVPAATVILGSSDRSFEWHTTTNREGEYFFQLVPPRKFSVQAQASGFAVAAVNVVVVVATPVRADLILGIQGSQQSVNVFGQSGIAVQTENAGLGRTISPQEISEVPSLTRSPYDFIALLPGANLSNDALGVGFVVNGARTQSANYLLDGSENNDTFMSAPAQSTRLH